MRNALPTIPIPLGEGDGEIPLDLNAAFDSTYDGGRYDMLVRYSAALPPQLSASDRTWAIELAAGMR